MSEARARNGEQLTQAEGAWLPGYSGAWMDEVGFVSVARANIDELELVNGYRDLAAAACPTDFWPGQGWADAAAGFQQAPARLADDGEFPDRVPILLARHHVLQWRGPVH